MCKQSVRVLTGKSGDNKAWFSSWWWPYGFLKAQYLGNNVDGQIKSLRFSGQSTGFAVQLPVQPLRQRAHWVANLSSWRKVKRGCPQGSVLDPLLRNMFQNDLSFNVESALSMYVDDHKIYGKRQNMYAVLAKLQERATLATDWYDSNLLHSNLKKYQTTSIWNKSVTCGDKMCLIVHC